VERRPRRPTPGTTLEYLKKSCMKKADIRRRGGDKPELRTAWTGIIESNYKISREQKIGREAQQRGAKKKEKDDKK